MAGQQHDREALIKRHKRAVRRYQRQLDTYAWARNEDREIEKRCIEIERRVAERLELLAELERNAKSVRRS